jgi:hypothetical protein
MLYREPFEKADRLSQLELNKVSRMIQTMQDDGKISSVIISKLQSSFPKLSMRWKAERAYWTEVKRMDTQMIGEAGDELDIEEYKAILSPNACPECREKTSNGAKIFGGGDIRKEGYGHVPPYHPGCFCILVPKI